MSAHLPLSSPFLCCHSQRPPRPRHPQPAGRAPRRAASQHEGTATTDGAGGDDEKMADAAGKEAPNSPGICDLATAAKNETSQPSNPNSNESDGSEGGKRAGGSGSEGGRRAGGDAAGTVYASGSNRLFNVGSGSGSGGNGSGGHGNGHSGTGHGGNGNGGSGSGGNGNGGSGSGGNGSGGNGSGHANGHNNSSECGP
jgi:hypothetical protein